MILDVVAPVAALSTDRVRPTYPIIGVLDQHADDAIGAARRAFTATLSAGVEPTEWPPVERAYVEALGNMPATERQALIKFVGVDWADLDTQRAMSVTWIELFRRALIDDEFSIDLPFDPIKSASLRAVIARHIDTDAWLWITADPSPADSEWDRSLLARYDIVFLRSYRATIEALAFDHLVAELRGTLLGTDIAAFHSWAVQQAAAIDIPASLVRRSELESVIGPEVGSTFS